ncbi:hypothetical protein ACVOMV_26165 (plasmid) [Mesorhizobium atlanticum]
MNWVGGFRGAASNRFTCVRSVAAWREGTGEAPSGEFSNVRDSIECTLIEIKASQRVAP